MAVFMLVCLVTGVSVRQIEPAVTLSGTVAVLALFGRQFLTIRSNVRLTRDLDEQRARFADEARHDPLTGLPNRALLNRSLARAGDDATLLMIDLDGFKAVNDTLGHTAGDDLLVVIADRLRAAIVPFDALACRLGGDEFAVLIRAGGLPSAEELARTLVERCAEPVPLNGRTAGVRASIGIAGRRPGRPADQLPQDADLALYEAKRGGKDRYHLFDADLAAARRHLEKEFVTALAEGQFELAYEPVVDLATGSTLGASAMPQWRHPRLGLLGPEAFDAAATDAGRHGDLDRWTVEAGLAQLRTWRAADPGFRIGVRLSGRHLPVADLVRILAAQPGLAGGVTLLVAGAGCPAELAPVRALGVRVVVESFDAARMADLAADGIRLDPAFLHGLDDGPEAAGLLAAVVARAESLSLHCVGYGVATLAQAAHLRRVGLRVAQGPLYGAPGPAATISVRAAIGA
jgi:diguanylate cyclase (GGDEF)-like protein